MKLTNKKEKQHITISRNKMLNSNHRVQTWHYDKCRIEQFFFLLVRFAGKLDLVLGFEVIIPHKVI